MVRERVNYVNIRHMLERCMMHPMLKSLDLEKVLYYTLQFIELVGMPRMYFDKQAIVQIDDYRGTLPCDLVSITQCRNTATGRCMRSMEGSFIGREANLSHVESTFKTQGRVIFTSFRTGNVELSYKALPVDEDGLPMLLDNQVFLLALELYIKKRVFTEYYDMGKLQAGILQNVQQEYSFAVGECMTELTMPSVSEMESIKNMWCSLIQRDNKFVTGFIGLGNTQHLKI